MRVTPASEIEGCAYEGAAASNATKETKYFKRYVQSAPARGHYALRATCAIYMSSSSHMALQPSPAIMLPSSHCSLPSTVPLPHSPLQPTRMLISALGVA